MKAAAAPSRGSGPGTAVDGGLLGAREDDVIDPSMPEKVEKTCLLD